MIVDLVARNYNLNKELLQADQCPVQSIKDCTRGEINKTAAEVIPATSRSADCLFSGIWHFKTYFRSKMGQNRLNSLTVICTECSYGNKVIVNSMDKIFTVSFDLKVVKVFVFHDAVLESHCCKSKNFRKLVWRINVGIAISQSLEQ